MPFQYNLHETSLASTSPFWTMLSIIFFWIADYKYIILLKTIILLVFIITSILIYLISRDMWVLKGFALYAPVLVWLIMVSVLKNAFGGMENIVSAFQLIAIYYIICRKKSNLNLKSTIGVGLFLGWVFLTRLDIGIISLILVLFFIIKASFEQKLPFTKILGYFLLVLTTALIVLLPWYIYQYSITGRFFSDSSVSRIYLGRWYSIILIKGIIYLHTNMILLFVTALLPFTVGLLWKVFTFKYENLKPKGNLIKYLLINFHIFTLMIILALGTIFYTFVVGGVQIGRYLVAIYPFYFLIGVYGMQDIYYTLKNKNYTLANLFIFLNCIFIIGVNFYDYRIRVFGGKDMEGNIKEMIVAPKNRENTTTDFLKMFNYNINDTVKVATTEVQFLYFVDDRIRTLSLDGRTSLQIFKYADRDGFPDFERCIKDAKPDIIEVKNWYNFLIGGGFPFNNIKFLKFGKKDNILSQWDHKISGMTIGDKFTWNGNEVQYLVPGYIKIIWGNKN